MPEITHESSAIAPRLLRCTPFVAVVLCFLLPFFSASSCDDGTETTATGFQIVAGSRLILHQVKQPLFLREDSGEPTPPPPVVPLGPIGPDLRARAVADAARPWAALTLFIVVLGGCLVVTMDRRWRGIRVIAAGLAVSAWVEAAMAVDSATPKQSRVDFSLDMGFVLPLLILVVTLAWGMWAVGHAHEERVDGSAGLGSAVAADRE